MRIAGEHRWAVVEDVARLRDALGVPLPPGVAEAHAEPVADPLGDLVSRYARTHGPFRAIDLATHLGIGVAVVTDALRRLGAAGRVVEGEFLPGGIAMEWCDSEILRLLRRRSLAALRKEVEPVDPSALARFLPAWQGITSSRGRGYDVLLGAVEQLAGCAVPASALESIVLPSRVPGYQPSMLDELTATGEVVWAGSGSLPGTDGWVSLHLADNCDLTLARPGSGVRARRDASGRARRAVGWRCVLLPPTERCRRRGVPVWSTTRRWSACCGISSGRAI